MVFGGAATGLFTTPPDDVRALRLERGAGGFALREDPWGGRVRWQVKRFPAR